MNPSSNEPREHTEGRLSTSVLESHRLLSMLRLGSAALPIGAFAYSQGLESAIADGVIRNAAQAETWIRGVLEHSLFTCDIPLLRALLSAFERGDPSKLESLDDRWRATRGTRELREEDRQLGASLMRLLSRQLSPSAGGRRASSPTFGYAFAYAGFIWGLDARLLGHSYCFAWFESQVGAAVRLIPLGQTEAQLVLSHLIDTAARGLEKHLERDECAVSSTTPGQWLHSVRHESLYSRLFRS